MLAACGLAAIDVVRRPKVAVLSTGDELVALGDTLRPGGVYDSNGAIIAAAIAEAGGEPVPFGAFPDDAATLEAGDAPRARRLRHGRAVGRHLEGRRRSLASRRVAARPARHPGAWRGAEARQAALPRGRRRQADRGAAGLSDLGDLHLPCLRRAGDPRPRRPAAGGRRDHRGARAAAHRLGDGPQGVRAGVAGRRRARRDGVSVGQGLRRGDELLAGRRLHRDRRARRARSTPTRRRASR